MEILNLIKFMLGILFIFLGFPLFIFWAFAKFRSYRISKLAKKYELEFIRQRPNISDSKKSFWEWLFWHTSEKNIIRGNINNHFLEIYDRQSKSFGLGGYTAASRRVTVMRIDGISRNVDGPASISLLNKTLVDLRDKNLIFARNLWIKKVIICAVLMFFMVALWLFVVNSYLK